MKNSENQSVKSVTVAKRSNGTANGKGMMGTAKTGQTKQVTTGEKKVWDKPVSQSFYRKLEGRVEEIFLLLGYPRGWRHEFMKFIDLYLKSGECPQRRYNDEFVLAIFYSLKGEVEAAVTRSAECRRRAAERRARKEAEKSSKACESEQSVGKETAEPAGDTMTVSEDKMPASETIDLAESSNEYATPDVSLNQEVREEANTIPVSDQITAWQKRYGNWRRGNEAGVRR